MTKVVEANNFPLSIYQPKNAIPSGWTWLGHTADGTKGLLVKATLPSKAGRNPALASGHSGSGMTNQPFPDLPQYQFLSTYFGGFEYNVPPGSLLRALRPDLILPGRYEMVRLYCGMFSICLLTKSNKSGDSLDTAVYTIVSIPLSSRMHRRALWLTEWFCSTLSAPHPRKTNVSTCSPLFA